MAPVDFSGTWKEEKRDNIEAFLQVMGVDPSKHASSGERKDQNVVVQDGDKIKWTNIRESGEHTSTFVADGTVQDLQWGPTTVKGMVSWDGATLVTVMKVKDDMDVTLQRFMDGDTMVMKMMAKGKTSTIYYKKI